MPSQRTSSQTASRDHSCFHPADASQKSASWDEARESVCCCWFDLRDERCWTCVIRAQQESARGSWFCGVKAGTRSLLPAWTIRLLGLHGLEALVHTHVDDFLSAFKKASKKYKDALQHLVHELHLKQQSGLVVYSGRTICRDGSHIKVTQTRSTMSLECMSIELGELWKARSLTLRSLDTEVCWDSCCGLDSSLSQTCTLVCL